MKKDTCFGTTGKRDVAFYARHIEQVIASDMRAQANKYVASLSNQEGQEPGLETEGKAYKLLRVSIGGHNMDSSYDNPSYRCPQN